MFYGVASNTLSGSTFGVSNGMANPALSFATVTDIRDTNIRVQPQVLLNNMNGWGLVDKNKALYPFVSDGYIESRATQHKYNLMNPADTDAAFRLTFFGGWTHSATGAKPNGSTGYAETYLNPTTHLASLSEHISYYARTTRLNPATYQLMGSLTSVGAIPQMALGISTNNVNIYGNIGNFNDSIGGSQTNLGMRLVSRGAAGAQKLYQDGVSVYSKTDNTATPNVTLNIGRVNGINSFYMTEEISITTIGSFLTDTEAANLYTFTQSLQTALFRNV